MGQAWRRGIYKKRREDAIARRTIEEQRRRQEMLAAEAAMTPEQRAQRAQTLSKWIGLSTLSSQALS